jgi:hypothetical protein
MPSGSRPIGRRTWLTLREAAGLIGKELLGREWSDGFLDKPGKESLIDDIERDLFTAMSSGEVTILLSYGDDPHVMKPAETMRLSFRINLAKNRIELRDPLDLWDCHINAHELELFFEEVQRITWRDEIS